MASAGSGRSVVDDLIADSLEQAARATDAERRAELLASVRELLAHSHNGSRPRAPTPTDDDMASRWLRHHPLTSWGLGEFRRYDGRRGVWPILPKDKARSEVADELVAAKAEGIRPTAHLVASVLELARLKVTRPPELWDPDPDLAACRNGVLRFSDRQLLPHSPEHFLTTGLAFDYDPKAGAPTWDWFVKTTVPTAADFLMEFAGYCLTTSTRHELAVWLYGPSGSGKSTCVLAFQTLLGERAGLLGLADLERNRFALSSLPGKTLVVATEQPADFITSGHILNALISGEPLTIDRKFLEAVTIVPRAKLLWGMNSLPRVSDSSSGLFRRVRVIEFSPRPEPERQPIVKENLSQEGAGLLNLALDGLARLQARGRFEVPAEIQAATENFRAANDVPGLFVEECCVIGPSLKAKAGQLYAAYKTWCVETGHRPQSMTSLATDWDRLGFTKYNAAGNVWRRGVGLKAEM